MKNKNRIYRAAALLLVLCFISTVMISGTFAKYTSTYSGQDTALVARWDFKGFAGQSGSETEMESSTDLNLFEHAYNKNINQKDGGDYIIAPGVNDDFTIKMSFLSDVDAKVTVDFTKDGTVDGNLPIEYLVVKGLDGDGNPTNSDWVELGDLPKKFVAMVAENNNVAVAAESADNTFTFSKSTDTATTAQDITQVVKWRWAFDSDEQGGSYAGDLESSDGNDTAFGNASAGENERLSYILNVSVKAEQIQPEETTP